MPAQKKVFCFLIALATFLLLPKVVFARVVINEFSSYGRDDWVEIYRTKSENLSLYYLEDETGNTKQLSWADCSGEFCTVDWYNKLNKSGDIIKLILVSNPFSPVDQVAYGDKGNDVAAPGEGQSAGRVTDGATSWNPWVIFSAPTKGSTNDTGTPAPTNTPPPTLTPTPTPTQTPTNTPTPTSTPSPSPTKATYKINEVKDEDGNTLSSVKVYVDGVYVHHYAPETLEFCDGCKCDDYVDCGFGEHTIKLEKSGYQDWSETKTMNAGDAHEVNPVMSPSPPSPTPTSTPTPTPTPPPRLIPTSTPTPIKTPTSTPSGEILGATETGEATESEAIIASEAKGEASPYLWPKILIGLGSALIIGASYPLWLPKLKMLYNSFHGKG